ncbi:HAD hydrolase family protein [Limosilactobacillus fermentum]|nr:HAD hydrolase family protein [Limosilactobacillus fermentum]
MVTFGDNENDLGLLTMTPQSYAMKNAAPFIQGQAANVTTHTNNESGVLRTINALLDQRIK